MSDRSDAVTGEQVGASVYLPLKRGSCVLAWLILPNPEIDFYRDKRQEVNE
jgi:hypothetical protein